MPAPTTNSLDDAVIAAYQAGDMERVVALGDRAALTSETALLWLGVARQNSGRYGQAVATFRQLTQMRPDVSAYWNNLGLACRQVGDLAAAEQSLGTARALAPNDAEVRYNLGLLQMLQRQWVLARQSLLEAARLAPQFIDARLQAAHACHVCGDNDGQQAMLAGAADWPPQAGEQALMLAAMLSAQGDTDGALRSLARAQLPDGSTAAAVRLRIAAQRVALYERGNQLERAREELQQVPLDRLEQLPPDADETRAEAWSAHAAIAMRDADHAGAAALYQRTLALELDEQHRAAAAFGLAAASDRLGRHAEAWQALQAAHAAQLAIAKDVVPELLQPHSRPLAMTTQRVDRSAFQSWTTLPAPADARLPIFVVGFPRSGTTLLEQMLDAHPDFRSMDERAFIHDLTERMELAGQRYPDDLANLTAEEAGQLRAIYFRRVGEVLPALGTHRLVDKNPLNMLCLPMIMRLFPRSRIILCLRHPCDVLLSCYMQPFRSPAFMVMCSSLQRLADGYVQAFEQWQQHVEVFAPRLLEWRYESVVSRFEESVASLGKFLEVEDASPMAQFSEHARGKRFISTPSYAQVTQGISSKAVNRWHAYRELFEPVLPTLRPLMQRLGYTE
ncbi:MAG TPA: sulfotransferase [Rhodanobacter sp.]|nr:sulfotransferase [Rhodanobacter sp.]